MSKVLSDSSVFDNALVEARGSAELPEGDAAEAFMESNDAAAAAAESSAQESTETPLEGVDDKVGEEVAPDENAGDDPEKDKVADDPDKHDELDENGQKKVEKPEDKKDDELDEKLDLNSQPSMKGFLNHLNKDPKFKAAVESNPALKSSLYAMGRMADRAGQYDGIFHSPALARTSKVAADEMFRMDELFNAEDPKEFAKFLIMNSLVYDEKGDPVVDSGTGRYQSTGAYERFANYWQSEWQKDVTGYAERLSKSEHEAAKADGEELIEAMKVLERVVFSRAAKPKATSEDDPELANLPPALRKEILESRAAKGSQATGVNQKLAAFQADFDTKKDAMLQEYAEALINNVLSKNQKIVLSPLSKKHILAEAVQNVKDAEKSNIAHSSTFKHMLRSAPQNEEGIKALLASKKAYFREIMPGFIRKAFSENTAETKAVAKQVADKTNKSLNRAEPRTSGRANAAPSGQGDFSEAIKAAETKKGKPLTDMERTDAILSAVHGTQG